MLKAFLVGRGLTVAPTHDVPTLLDECAKAGGAFDSLTADCQRLNAYAVTFRYPGPGPDPTEAEGRAAVAAARRIYVTTRAAHAPPPPPAGD